MFVENLEIEINELRKHPDKDYTLPEDAEPDVINNYTPTGDLVVDIGRCIELIRMFSKLFTILLSLSRQILFKLSTEFLLS